ncbi:Cip1p Ecym_7316 [Eremothecium cymbalariae DBVPG|uniref:Uncharacterized protein n=1 Tax=Eremothecium cymbalariae (strain CBS 270.75 / DBVPG 7215 / KCTC 17166 / NRRL Y-17582) TaxID=931890 RepID=G8JWD6_ERECY|nr:hypothetical protein Ecym_7316 [Eremothecium cymbalariae DBVPG\
MRESTLSFNPEFVGSSGSKHGNSILLEEIYPHCGYPKTSHCKESRPRLKVNTSLATSLVPIDYGPEIPFTFEEGCELGGSSSSVFDSAASSMYNMDYGTEISAGYREDVSQMDLTPVHTPVNRLDPFFKRCNDSVTSLASSVSDFSDCTPLSPQPNFTPDFVRLLLNTYYLACSDSTGTPFDHNNPPSGILNKVAKLAVEISDRDGLEIGCGRDKWLLTAIRKRILQEVRKEAYLSRNSSLMSLPSTPYQFDENASDINGFFLDQLQYDYPNLHADYQSFQGYPLCIFTGQLESATPFSIMSPMEHESFKSNSSVTTRCRSRSASIHLSDPQCSATSVFNDKSGNDSTIDTKLSPLTPARTQEISVTF